MIAENKLQNADMASAEQTLLSNKQPLIGLLVTCLPSPIPKPRKPTLLSLGMIATVTTQSLTRLSTLLTVTTPERLKLN